MAVLPSATVQIDDTAGAQGGGEYAVIMAPVGTNADGTPRVFSSSKGIYDMHGYAEGVDFAAQFIDGTGLPVIFVGMPVATPGAVTLDVTGVTGTSVVTSTGDALDEMDGVLTVTTGGAIGTAGIVFTLSLDGGRNSKTIRLGTANSYAIPYYGVTLHFGVGALVAGDVVTFTATAPMWDAAGLTAARTALAAQQKTARSWNVIGDLTSSALATDIVTEANTYETSVQRFVIARASVRDRLVSEATFAAYVSAMDTLFAPIDGQKRIDLSLGRARMLSPITGYAPRRPAFWALAIREYQHSPHIPTYRKADGPLTNCDMTDGSGQVVEYDERTVGGALAARFSCLRTYANGPNGAYVALSLTRDAEGSLLSRTHNMHVVNVAQTVCQKQTENAIGQVLQLNADGTGTKDSLQKIEERVNSALQAALLKQGPEGPMASSAVWSASKTDPLNVPGATLTGTLVLNLNGTIEKIETSIKVLTGG